MLVLFSPSHIQKITVNKPVSLFDIDSPALRQAIEIILYSLLISTILGIAWWQLLKHHKAKRAKMIHPANDGDVLLHDTGMCELHTETFVR